MIRSVGCESKHEFCGQSNQSIRPFSLAGLGSCLAKTSLFGPVRERKPTNHENSKIINLMTQALDLNKDFKLGVGHAFAMRAPRINIKNNGLP